MSDFYRYKTCDIRHTFATNLARSGVHPKIAMDLLDHSDINLTMAYYSHTDVKERAAALSGLPSLVDSRARIFSKCLRSQSQAAHTPF
ncbi:MAG: tyrosine-type recombinase/integrase [Aliifodinibius sp.]|nr:tyrosine-type recombinase/integrase [candidate division Zixibacteria bacterium]NIT57290.1 tyrosine-type recombinase/integrase [Fodinibius sp.]NIW45107.1 tyrosine-type recombinase/integrase [Gammaproteobacteria bacterium]NIW98820.1 tyrosine-type recombinase/integrase [Phycisphaerae bacterium]NIR64257.1 tyrosine-type recombinase/integrase [candidate division Zixibacteria bacterium]